MEFQQRKINRIPEYDYAQNGAYFVTICTQNRKKTLSSIVGDGSPVPKLYGLVLKIENMCIGRASKALTKPQRCDKGEAAF